MNESHHLRSIAIIKMIAGMADRIRISKSNIEMHKKNRNTVALERAIRRLKIRERSLKRLKNAYNNENPTFVLCRGILVIVFSSGISTVVTRKYLSDLHENYNKALIRFLENENISTNIIEI